MIVQCPLLPISGNKDELQMFSHFVSRHPRMTGNDYCVLVKLFLTQSNVSTIFPKLLYMLKHYCMRWEHNALVRQVESLIKSDIDSTTKSLICERVVLTVSPYEYDPAPPDDKFENAIVPLAAAPTQTLFVETVAIIPRNFFCCYYYPYGKRL